MRRPAAAITALLIPAVIGAAGAAAAQTPAPPPLTLENAKPLAIPARPRLTTHKAPPVAPPPLTAPELLAFPDVPQLVTPAAVAPPPDPAGGSPAVKPTAAKPPAAPLPAKAATPPPLPPSAPLSAEERVAAAAQATPAIVAPPAPSPAAPVAAAPPPAAFARAGMLAFPAGSALLPDDSETLLATVAEEMRAAPSRRLQLRAYASGEVDSDRQARQLSLTRALAVRERLTALGVRSTRIDVRPLGLAAPPVDSDRRDRVDLEYTSE